MERWKAVDWLPEYGGVLEVSSRGRVRRLELVYSTTGRWGTVHTATKPGIILSQYTGRSGYPEVAVQTDGRRKKLRVHRLVGMAFVPGYKPGLTINHINCDKGDNRAENLEWVTLAINTKKQWQDGLVAGVPRKLTSGKVRIIRELLALGVSPLKIATLSDVDAKTIYKIKSGVAWRYA